MHQENRGYDLVSRSQGGDVRYIEVKGRAGVGGVEPSENEWLKEEVVPHVRYRVTREGWDSVAERAVTYNV